LRPLLIRSAREEHAAVRGIDILLQKLGGFRPFFRSGFRVRCPDFEVGCVDQARAATGKTDQAQYS
jgi:hypothetical protein